MFLVTSKRFIKELFSLGTRLMSRQGQILIKLNNSGQNQETILSQINHIKMTTEEALKIAQATDAKLDNIGTEVTGLVGEVATLKAQLGNIGVDIPAPLAAALQKIEDHATAISNLAPAPTSPVAPHSPAVTGTGTTVGPL